MLGAVRCELSYLFHLGWMFVLKICASRSICCAMEDIPMRTLIMLLALTTLVGCTRVSLDRHLDEAYRHYDEGNCEQAILDLSRAERNSRARSYVQPEISMLRAQCLERQNLFVDATQVYKFIITRYPASEYA